MEKPRNSSPPRAIFLSLCLVVFLSIIWKPGLSQDGLEKTGGTVIIGMKGDFDSFNELNASDSDALQVIQNMLFMGLTRLDENLHFVPHLASSWEFSDTERMLTYHLRKDVYWTDGVPTTAEDVLFTYQLAVNPKVAYPAVSRFDLTEKVEVSDRYTVRFHFKKRYPDALSDTQMPILPRHILAKIAPEKIIESQFNRRPVGNGPFKLVEWRANQHVVLEANPRYALGRPFLDRVVFMIIPDESVLSTNLSIQTLDVVPAMTPLGFKQMQSQNAVRALRYPGRGFTFVGWNNKKALFSKGVRQALTLAINKQEIIQTLFEGFAQEANGPLLPFVWAYDEELTSFPYDPEAARRLLKQEGWLDSDGDGILDKSGEKLSFSIKTNAGNQMRRDTAVMIQAQLQQIGIKAEVETVEWNLFIEQVFSQKDFDAVILGWDADFTVNPTALWHSTAVENGYNFVSYTNPKVDLLLEQGRTISHRDLAKPVWREFQRIIVEDAPYTFLFVPDKLVGFNERIRGVKTDVRGFLADIEQWWIPEEKWKADFTIEP